MTRVVSAEWSVGLVPFGMTRRDELPPGNESLLRLLGDMTTDSLSNRLLLFTSTDDDLVALMNIALFFLFFLPVDDLLDDLPVGYLSDAWSDEWKDGNAHADDDDDVDDEFFMDDDVSLLLDIVVGLFAGDCLSFFHRFGLSLLRKATISRLLLLLLLLLLPPVLL